MQKPGTGECVYSSDKEERVNNRPEAVGLRRDTSAAAAMCNWGG